MALFQCGAFKLGFADGSGADGKRRSVEGRERRRVEADVALWWAVALWRTLGSMVWLWWA